MIQKYFRPSRRLLLLGAGLPLTTAGFIYFGRNYYYNYGVGGTTPLTQTTPVATTTTSAIQHTTKPDNIQDNNEFTSLSSIDVVLSENSRTRQTWVDDYYQQYKTIPQPTVMHATLQINNNNNEKSNNNKILVIGDVHGCYNELLQLHNKAKQEYNHGNEFDYVILVGDLVNKGYASAKVVRHVRQQPNWYTVRGNHDDGALYAAVGDETRRAKKKYQWVMDGEETEKNKYNNNDDDSIVLSDADVVWMAELPYTLTIPGNSFFPITNNNANNNVDNPTTDIIIVHGGFVPGIDLSSQEIESMITIREVSPICQNNNVVEYKFHERKKDKEAKVPEDKSEICEKSNKDKEKQAPRPWASVWDGPQRVIFGHDARRGLQQHDMAIGLDTGAVYGKQLTGIILPEMTIVSIETEVHSPIGGQGN